LKKSFSIKGTLRWHSKHEEQHYGDGTQKVADAISDSPGHNLRSAVENNCPRRAGKKSYIFPSNPDRECMDYH
jgi:hypothetical protein